MLNVGTLIGRLTVDFVMKTSEKSGKTFARNTIVTERRYNQGGEWKKETSFIPFVLFGNQAETAMKYVGKGSLVCLQGHIVSRSKGEGKERKSWIEFFCEQIHFLSFKEKKAEQSPDENVPIDVPDADKPEVPF